MSRAMGVASSILLAACTSQSLVPCADDTTCASLGALCVEGVCRRPDEVEIDLSTAEGDGGSDGGADLLPMCVDDGACSDPASPICDALTRTCRACTPGDCPGATPVCLVGGADVGRCVACALDTDCANPAPLCEVASHTCVPCTRHAQCPSKVCDAGSCAQASDVLHVDLNQQPCAGADGSVAKPYCQISDALAVAKPYILVAASASHYGALVVSATDATPRRVIGPGGTTAIVEAATTDVPAVEIAPATGHSVDLTLEGLYFTAYGGSLTPAGIDCTTAGGGTATLTLIDDVVTSVAGDAITSAGCTIDVSTSRIQYAKQVGLRATGGRVEVRRAWLEGNHTGALVLGSGVTYAIENDVFNANRVVATPGAAVSFADDASGTFRFNAVTGTTTGGAAAIACGAGASKLIEASFLSNNGTVSFGGNCTYASVVTPTGDSSPTTHANAVYDGNDVLTAGNATNIACCFDKASSGPAIDYAGAARPKGAAWDIGPYEVQ